MDDHELEMAAMWRDRWVSDHPDYNDAHKKWLDAERLANSFVPTFDENVTDYIRGNATRLAELKRAEADALKNFESTKKSLQHKFGVQSGLGSPVRGVRHDDDD